MFLIYHFKRALSGGNFFVRLPYHRIRAQEDMAKAQTRTMYARVKQCICLIVCLLCALR